MCYVSQRIHARDIDIIAIPSVRLSVKLRHCGKTAKHNMHVYDKQTDSGRDQHFGDNF